MKGIICRSENNLEKIELESPTLLDGHAIVRIKRIGICGTDQHAYRGNQPFFIYPRILGHELAGVIEDISQNDKGLNIGDQVGIIPYLACGHCIACRNGKTNCCTDIKVMGVHIDGGMCELISVPITHLIQANDLSLDQAAVLEPLSIGAHAVRRSEIKTGETVMVIGAGPIGLGVMAFAKHRGARVIAMDINDQRLEFCREWANADETINPIQDPEFKLKQITNGEFPTIVFDVTGNLNSMSQAFNFVAHGGKLVYVGLVKANISFHDPDFHKREMTLMGSRNATREDFDAVFEAVKQGSINVERFISHRASFDEMIDQFETWLKPESKVIKAMIEL